jgi:carbamoyl-phosphate synthase large subunit
MARLATELMMGRRLAELRLERRPIPHFGVKEAVFPFDKLPEVDPLLGPEMRSTGEVLGIAGSFELAFFKAQEAAKPPLPTEGTVLISLAEKPPLALEVAREFAALGFRIRATCGTAAFLAAHGVPAEPIRKLHEGRPHIADAIKNREIQLVVNTPSGRRSEYDDSYIRKTAIRYQVPYITTLPAALASARGIAARRRGGGGVSSLQAYHAGMAVAAPGPGSAGRRT